MNRMAGGGCQLLGRLPLVVDGFSNFSQQRRWFSLLIGSMDDWLKLAAIPIWSHGKSLGQGDCMND